MLLLLLSPIHENARVVGLDQLAQKNRASTIGVCAVVMVVIIMQN